MGVIYILLLKTCHVRLLPVVCIMSGLCLANLMKSQTQVIPHTYLKKLPWWWSSVNLYCSAPSKKKVTKIVRKWKNADLTAQPVAGRVTEPPKDFFPEIRIPTEIFELLLDDDIVELTVRYSHLYAASKGVNMGLTCSEFKCFLGIIFQTGYVSVPRRRVLW